MPTDGLDHLGSADDRIIAGRVADGDVAAMGVLVRRYGPMMKSCARRIMRSSADVDDVVQETFIAAWQKMDQLEDPSRVKAWLMRTVSHRAIDRLRAAKPSVAAEEVELPAAEKHSPPRKAEANAAVEALREALDGLPEAQRQCWMLREVDGMSYRDIAEATELSESTVRGLLARARKTLMGRMEGWK